MEKQLLVTSLFYHDADFIYKFLKQNVGPLCMTLKDGRAIMQFNNPGHAALALSRYNRGNINDLPFRLASFDENAPKYVPIDIVPVATTQVLEPMIEEKPTQAKEPQVQLSEFTLLIQQTLKVKDPENEFQKATKEFKKQLMEFVNAYAPLQQTVELRRQQILSKFSDPTEQEKKRCEFYQFYKQQLAQFMRTIKKQLKFVRRRCQKQEKQENIEIQPSFQIGPLSLKKVQKLGSFKNQLQYILPEKIEIKRISAISQKHFVTTLKNRRTGTGNLAFHQIQDEYPQATYDVKQGAYGLLTLDKHILVGTTQGSIAFFDIADLNNQELSPRLHDYVIFDLVHLSRRQDGYNLLSLGLDNCLKIWNVAQQSYAQNATTLFFKQTLCIQGEQSIKSAAVFDSKMAYCRNKSIYVHDCVTNKQIATQSTTAMLNHIAFVGPQVIATAGDKRLSFVDYRNNAKTLNFDLSKNVIRLGILSQNLVIYGCIDGEVGVVDRRLTRKDRWCTTAYHKTIIYDICRIGDMVITGDKNGQLASWVPNDPPLAPSRSEIVAQYK